MCDFPSPSIDNYRSKLYCLYTIFTFEPKAAETRKMMNRHQTVLLLALVLLVGSLLPGCGGTTEDTAEWHFDEGNKLVEKGRYDEAIEECTKAIALDPSLVKAYFWRAVAYYQKTQYDLAIADCNKVIEIDPNLVEAYVNRAAAYCAQMQYDLAIADCNKVIEIDSGMCGVAYLYRGYVHSRRGQHELAIADRDKAIAIDPNLAYSAMGLIYYIN